jgi:hypothetical protein
LEIQDGAFPLLSFCYLNVISSVYRRTRPVAMQSPSAGTGGRGTRESAPMQLPSAGVRGRGSRGPGSRLPALAVTVPGLVIPRSPAIRIFRMPLPLLWQLLPSLRAATHGATPLR